MTDLSATSLRGGADEDTDGRDAGEGKREGRERSPVHTRACAHTSGMSH